MGWGYDENAANSNECMSINAGDGNADNVDINMVDCTSTRPDGRDFSDVERVFRKAKLRRERVAGNVWGSLGRAWRGTVRGLKGKSVSMSGALGGVGMRKGKRRESVRDVEWGNGCD